MQIRIIFSALFFTLFISGCAVTRTTNLEPPQRFRRVFSWGRPTNDEIARKYSEIGVTDMRVYNKKELALALKYGITPYCGTFLPCGKHGQVMSVKEEKHFAYINGHDLKGIAPAEKKKVIDERRIAMKHRYGGEPDVALDTLNSTRIACFLSDTNCELSKKSIDKMCSRVKGVKGVFFDYLGYSNFKGCYCEGCLKAYNEYLANNKLADTQKNKNLFYRDTLVAYYNKMIDYVKSKHPEFTVVVHVYPTFLPEPLYGNRTKADFCGQTVAWYFPWNIDKITKYTKITVDEQNKYFKNAQGVPFVGLNKRPGSLWNKPPETLEKELRTILQAGGDMLMVCNGADMLKPGIYEVFKKYCAKE